MDKMTWDTDEATPWIGKFPNKRVLNVGRAIYRYECLRAMGYSDEEARRDAFKFLGIFMEEKDA